MKTRDYAIPGSVVDYTLIPGMKDSSLTNNFVDQVATFKADLAKMDMRNLPAPESVYIVEFGINDINLSLDSFSASEASMIVDRYGSLIEDVLHPPPFLPLVYPHLLTSTIPALHHRRHDYNLPRRPPPGPLPPCHLQRLPTNLLLAQRRCVFQRRPHGQSRSARRRTW